MATRFQFDLGPISGSYSYKRGEFFRGAASIGINSPFTTFFSAGIGFFKSIPGAPGFAFDVPIFNRYPRFPRPDPDDPQLPGNCKPKSPRKSPFGGLPI
jgi:hypothetical protein